MYKPKHLPNCLSRTVQALVCIDDMAFMQRLFDSNTLIFENTVKNWKLGSQSWNYTNCISQDYHILRGLIK